MLPPKNSPKPQILDKSTDPLNKSYHLSFVDEPNLTFSFDLGCKFFVPAKKDIEDLFLSGVGAKGCLMKVCDTLY